ncbi:MAG: hypothetical protein KAW93_10790 [Methanogenium sp.]|nr:hypothetical protein [Methanogenium sp.]
MEHSKAKYAPGDIVDFEDGYQDHAYVILDYDKSTDKYLRTRIHRDKLGQWTRAHAPTERDWDDRQFHETFFKFRVGHVDIEDLKIVYYRPCELFYYENL